MNAYEKMIRVIRKESEQSERAPALKMCEMNSGESCVMDGMTLDADDLVVSDHLQGKLKKGDLVLITKVSDETYAIIAKVVSM